MQSDFKKRYGKAGSIYSLSKNFEIDKNLAIKLKDCYEKNIEIKRTEQEAIKNALDELLTILKEDRKYQECSLSGFKTLIASDLFSTMYLTTPADYHITFIYDPIDERFFVMSVDAFKQAKRNNFISSHSKTQKSST